MPVTLSRENFEIILDVLDKAKKNDLPFPESTISGYSPGHEFSFKD
jgi:hypothetical protein